MEENKLAVAILGVVVVIAIIGLVFMFTAAKSGAVAHGSYGSYVVPKIYTNYDQTPFPYSREATPRFVVEHPAGTISGEYPGAPTYAGASEFFITSTEKGVQSTLGPTYTTYGRSAETDIPTAKRSGVALEFPGEVRANYCYGVQQYYTRSAEPSRTCFTEDRYGRKVADLLPQYYGCCDS